LQLLGVAAALRSLSPILPQVLVVTGQNRRMMQVNLFALLVLPPTFVIGSRWGTAGIAIGWISVYPVFVLAPMAWFAFRQVGLGVGGYLHALRAPLTGVAIMCAAVWTGQLLQPADFPRIAALVVDISTGALAYLGSLMLFHRDRLVAIRSSLRTTTT